MLQLAMPIGHLGNDYSPEGLWTVATRRYELEAAICHFLDAKFSRHHGWLDSEPLEREFIDFYLDVIHHCWLEIVNTDDAYHIRRVWDNQRNCYGIRFRPRRLYDTFIP
jgi:hypothetical protein